MSECTENGITVLYENDVWGHMTEVKAAEDITETYEYDKMGSITAATDGEGRRREYRRNIRGNTDRIKYADGRTVKMNVNINTVRTEVWKWQREEE
ncbi:MAG: hypothetical protein K2M60_02300 [Lachnospiraceae bacterium]|nr:hypothetical protein [Lachnospiraceae bacterium]MDE6251047.1 hypothetical protein [Lachnospiraceae bacterium]